MYYPLNYEQINMLEGSYFPSTVKKRNNMAYNYWFRSLFQRACSVIVLDVDDMYKGDVKDFLYYCLFICGYVTFFEHSKYGLTFQPCTLSGVDWYYRPNKAIVTNPLFSKEMTISKDCELVKLTPDYMGIGDIIDYYACKLSSMDSAIDMTIDNCKLPFVMYGKTKSAVAFIKKLFDKISHGESLVVGDSAIVDELNGSEPLNIVDRAMKNNYILPEQLQDVRTLLNAFDTEIGIPTIPYEKKERMVQSEAESKQIESIARCTVWCETLNSCFDLVNKHYGTSFKAYLRYSERSEESEPSEDYNNRDTEVS